VQCTNHFYSNSLKHLLSIFRNIPFRTGSTAT